MSSDRFLITKIALIFLLVFFFFAYLGMRYFSLPMQSNTKNTTNTSPVSTNAPLTIIEEAVTDPSVSPKPIAKLDFNSTLTDNGETSYAIGRPVKVDLNLSGQAVTATDIVINYDPMFFDISEITNGEIFDIVLKKNIDSTSGVITYSAALSSEEAQSAKLGRVFSFVLTPRLSGTSKLSIDTKKTVLALSSVDFSQKDIPLDFPIVVK